MTKNIDIPKYKKYLDIATFGSVLLITALPLVACGGDEFKTRNSAELSKVPDGWKELSVSASSKQKKAVIMYEKLMSSGESVYAQCLADFENDPAKDEKQIGEINKCIGASVRPEIGLEYNLYSVSLDDDGAYSTYVNSNVNGNTEVLLCMNDVDSEGFVVQPKNAEPCTHLNISNLGESYEGAFVGLFPQAGGGVSTVWYKPSEVTNRGLTIDIFEHEMTGGGFFSNPEIGAPISKQTLSIRASAFPGLSDQFIRPVSIFVDEKMMSQIDFVVGPDDPEYAQSEEFRSKFDPESALNDVAVRCFVNYTLVKGTANITGVSQCEYSPVAKPDQLNVSIVKGI